jgi:hypothetical protein
MAKLRMLGHLYAPSYSPQLEAFVTAAARVGVAAQNAQIYRAIAEQNPQLRQELQREYGELGRIIGGMRDALVAESRQLTAESTANLPRLGPGPTGGPKRS